MGIRNIVFDFGRVLVDWNPRYLFDKVFPTVEESERFLRDICTMDWNVQMDCGKPYSVGTEELSRLYPEWREQIMLYDSRWFEMMGDEIPGMEVLLEEITAKGLHRYGLSNWSAEKFPRVRETYPIFRHMEGMVVSGDVKAIKPHPAIYRILMEKYSLTPGECLFVDDNKDNVQGALDVGMNAVLFTGADDLRKYLRDNGIL